MPVFLRGRAGIEVPQSHKSMETENDIAIVGMSCRFPGARNIDEFWRNLTKGVESSGWWARFHSVQVDFPPVSPSCSVRWDRSANTEKSLPRQRSTSCRGPEGEWNLVRFCNHQTETVSNLLLSRSEELVRAFVARPITTIAPSRAHLNPISRLF